MIEEMEELKRRIASVSKKDGEHGAVNSHNTSL
jgi:hypothetical protein